MWNILLATEKPFAASASDKIKEVASSHEDISLHFLEAYESEVDLLNAVGDKDALIIRSDKITNEVIEAAPRLKLVVRAGSGYDNVDLNAASARDIVVMNTPGQNANAVAELAFGLMVTMIRGQFNGKPGSELGGKTLGLHGYGNIGHCMARIALGFEMKILAYDPYVSEVGQGVEILDSVTDLYKKSDFVSLSIPANSETINSINYELLLNAKDDLVLINTARQEIIDEEGLVSIMKEKEFFRFCSDIAPSNKDELLELFRNRCLFTKKKMGAQTREANSNAGVAAINQTIDFFKTGNKTFQVN